MAIKTVFTFVFIIFTSFLFSLVFSTEPKNRILKEYEKYYVEKSEDSKTNFDLWKFEGNEEKLYLLWKSIAIQLEFDTAERPEDFVLYLNSNKTQILLDYDARQQIFGFFQKWSLWKSTRIFPFSPTYVGVETKNSYYISLKTTNVDFFLVFLFYGGIFLFFLAKSLSRNAAAFYLGGSSLGICLSLLLFIFVLYRMIPKKSLGVSMLVGGWSFTLYLVYSAYQNIFTIFEQYQRLLACYLVSVGLISFIFCYRWGPPRDVRSQNLIQWSIQLISLIMIYCGSQIQSVSAVVITIILIGNNIPKRFYKTISKIKYRYFPPKPRLLSEEEYIYQGMVETRKALGQLRDYCRSPECDSWRLMSRLDTPQRFASFVSGDSHLSDAELMMYDAEASVEESEDEPEPIMTPAASRPGPAKAQTGVPPRRFFDSNVSLNRSSTSRYVERYSFGSPAGPQANGYGTSQVLSRADSLSEDDD